MEPTGFLKSTSATFAPSSILRFRMGVRKRPPYEGGTSHGDVTTFGEGVDDWSLPPQMTILQ